MPYLRGAYECVAVGDTLWACFCCSAGKTCVKGDRKTIENLCAANAVPERIYSCCRHCPGFVPRCVKKRRNIQIIQNHTVVSQPEIDRRKY